MGKILERLSKIAENKEITIGALERSIGASKGVLSRAIANGTDIQNKWIISIVENYPEISPDWLLTGRGPMLRTETATKAHKAQRSTSGIPLIPIDAVAGFPSFDSDAVKYEDCQHYQVPEFAAKGVEFLIRVSGSSMYPKYSNGDLLACKKIMDILFFQWGKVYVIDSSQGPLVKRIFEDKENSESIICVSDNAEKYPPFKMPKSDIRSLSIVLGVIRME